MPERTRETVGKIRDAKDIVTDFSQNFAANNPKLTQDIKGVAMNAVERRLSPEQVRTLKIGGAVLSAAREHVAKEPSRRQEAFENMAELVAKNYDIAPGRATQAIRAVDTARVGIQAGIAQKRQLDAERAVADVPNGFGETSWNPAAPSAELGGGSVDLRSVEPAPETGFIDVNANQAAGNVVPLRPAGPAAPEQFAPAA